MVSISAEVYANLKTVKKVTKISLTKVMSQNLRQAAIKV